jgi:hypothetical protein
VNDVPLSFNIISNLFCILLQYMSIRPNSLSELSCNRKMQDSRSLCTYDCTILVLREKMVVECSIAVIYDCREPQKSESHQATNWVIEIKSVWLCATGGHCVQRELFCYIEVPFAFRLMGSALS